MSLQRALVRLQIAYPDCSLIDPGVVIDREGLDWKFQPLDPDEREEWSRTVRDDARVEKDRITHGPNEWRFVPADKTPETHQPVLPAGAERLG